MNVVKRDAESGDGGYCGNSAELDDAVAKFAFANVKQTDRDHDALRKARHGGRIRAATRQVVAERHAELVDTSTNYGGFRCILRPKEGCTA